MNRRSRAAALTAALTLASCHRPAPQPPSTRAPVGARADAVTSADAVVAFARLYGYVRYFHPSDAAHEAEWAEVAADGVQAARSATTYAELVSALESSFSPYVHDLQLWVEPEPAPPRPPPAHRRDGLVYWQHQGYEGTPISLFRPPYASVRVTPKTRYERRFTEAPDPSRPIERALLGPLRVRLPTVLSTRSAAASTPVPTHRLDPTDLDELAVREALLVDTWNALRHFYPYQDEVDVSWEDILREALRDTADDRTEADMLDSIRTLTRALQDGHARVDRDGMRGRGWLPMRTECVGEALVVTASDTPKVRAGDVIERFDDVPAMQRVRTIAERLSGTARWRRFRACTWDGARGPLDDPAQLQLQRGGSPIEATVRFDHRSPTPPQRPEALTTMADGVLYVDLTRLSWTDLKPELETMAAAPGIVFDVRGYPIHNDDLLDHLMTEPEDATWMHVPRFIEPGGVPVGFSDIGWFRRPSTPRLEGPVAFLISPAAISYAESILAYVDTHQLGALVGTATAGANGDIVRHDSLAGFYVVFSGMRVTRHDGTPFHNEGIRPTVEVEPTVLGIRRGEDEVLDAGLRHVRAEIATGAAAAGAE